MGAYWRRDTDSDKPRNDRGISFAYGGMRVPDFDPSGAVRNWGWMAQLKFGKSLETTDTNGVRESFDLDSDRQILKGSAYYQPAIGGIPREDRGAFTSFYGADLGLYSDHLHGSGRPTVDGRLTGVPANVSANFAPLGLDPSLIKSEAAH